MITWLYTTVYSLWSGISSGVKDFVHAVVHALIGALDAVAGRMWTVWWSMLSTAWTAVGVFAWFCRGVWYVLYWLVILQVPALWTQAQGLLHQLVDMSQWLYNTALGWLHDAESLAQRLADNTVAWVTRNVWNPLWGYVQDLYAKLTTWGWTAYYYVTHPDDLAQLLFWALFGVFARNAFGIGRYIGDWVLRLVLANLAGSVNLAEEILTDVL